MRPLLALALILSAAVAACRAQVPAAQSPCDAQPNQVLTVPEAAYGPESSQRLDLYLPWHRAGEPLVVFVHGGGWSGDDKRNYGHIGQFFARCGIAFANINYPLAPQARADRQAKATLEAARWLAHRAAVYGYAGDRLFLFGHSAGAQIVTLAALWQPFEQLRAEVPLSGVIAMDGLGYAPSGAAVGQLPPYMVTYYRTAFGPDASTWRRFDVERQSNHHVPPFLIVHAADDASAPEKDSSSLAAALAKAGARVSYSQPEGRDHTTVISTIARDPNDPTGIALEHFIFDDTLSSSSH